MGESTFGTDEAPVRDLQEVVKKPPLYRVLLHNDHYTSMDFVVEILKTVFFRATVESVEIMMKVHNEGVGIAGVYPSEIAETKVSTVRGLARDHGFPLLCSMEPEEVH